MLNEDRPSPRPYSICYPFTYQSEQSFTFFSLIENAEFQKKEISASIFPLRLLMDLNCSNFCWYAWFWSAVLFVFVLFFGYECTEDSHFGEKLESWYGRAINTSCGTLAWFSNRIMRQTGFELFLSSFHFLVSMSTVVFFSVLKGKNLISPLFFLSPFDTQENM